MRLRRVLCFLLSVYASTLDTVALIQPKFQVDDTAGWVDYPGRTLRSEAWSPSR